jgi:hypothetical protein
MQFLAVIPRMSYAKTNIQPAHRTPKPSMMPLATTMCFSFFAGDSPNASTIQAAQT